MTCRRPAAAVSTSTTSTAGTNDTPDHRAGKLSQSYRYPNQLILGKEVLELVQQVLREDMLRLLILRATLVCLEDCRDAPLCVEESGD